MNKCWKRELLGSVATKHNIFLYINSLCSLQEVLEAIAESSFKTTSWPVILSFENRVSDPAKQVRIAQYCKEIFGDLLLDAPIEDYPVSSFDLEESKSSQHYQECCIA